MFMKANLNLNVNLRLHPFIYNFTVKKNDKKVYCYIGNMFRITLFSASYNAVGDILKIVRVLGRWTVKKY